MSTDTKISHEEYFSDENIQKIKNILSSWWKPSVQVSSYMGIYTGDKIDTFPAAHKYVIENGHWLVHDNIEIYRIDNIFSEKEIMSIFYYIYFFIVCKANYNVFHNNIHTVKSIHMKIVIPSAAKNNRNRSIAFKTIINSNGVVYGEVEEHTYTPKISLNLRVIQNILQNVM